MWESSLTNSSLLFNPQFQSFKLLLGHALQSHRCGQIQSGNVFHLAAVCYLASKFLYLGVSAHFQKHIIRLGDRESLFNQAMLHQNAMIRRYGQRRWMGRGGNDGRAAGTLVLDLFRVLVPALFWVFHCTMSSRVSTLNVKVDAGGRPVLGDFLAFISISNSATRAHFAAHGLRGLGNGAGAGLSNLYYPRPERSWTDQSGCASSGLMASSTWPRSLAGY